MQKKLQVLFAPKSIDETMPTIPLESDSGGVQLPVQSPARNSVIFNKPMSDYPRTIGHTKLIKQGKVGRYKFEMESRSRKMYGRAYKVRLKESRDSGDAQAREHATGSEVAEEVKASSKLPHSSRRKSFKSNAEGRADCSVQVNKAKKIIIGGLCLQNKKYKRTSTPFNAFITDMNKEKERIEVMVERVSIKDK